jgi:hypothetical protein
VIAERFPFRLRGAEGSVILGDALSQSAPDYPTTRTTRSRAARWSLMPTGIAAHYAASATPTSEPNSRPRKAGVSASAISQEITPFRSWCVTGALTGRRRVQSVKRVALPPKGDSNALRHEQSKRPAGAKVLSGRAGRPPSFSKFTLPVHNRQSICFQRLGARVLLV